MTDRSPPAELPPWMRTLLDALKDAREDRISHTAAGVAFYWFLAIFPLVIALIGAVDLLGLGPFAMFQLEIWVRSVVPGGAAELIVRAMRQGVSEERGVIGPLVAVAVATWSSSRGMIATQIGLNVAHDLPSDRSFVRQRLVALGLLAAIALIGGAALLLALLGRPLGGLIDRLPGPLASLGGLWPVLAWTVALAAAALLLTILYAFGPNRRPPTWRWFSPGVLAATAGWALAALGFSFYVGRFGGSYAQTYGPIADVVVLLLWLYFTALAVLFGAELNAQIERHVSNGGGESPLMNAGRTGDAPRSP